MRPNHPVDRRTFLATSGALVAAATVGAVGAAAQPARRRLALAGTGSRGSGTWGEDLVQHYADRIELVGLFDRNGLQGPRGAALDRHDGSCLCRLRHDGAPGEARRRIVATVDATHAAISSVRSISAVDVLTEKPMCTDENAVPGDLDAVARTGRTVTVTHNARHRARRRRSRRCSRRGPSAMCWSVDFHEYLDTSHGADYFRVAPVSRELRDAAVPQGVTPFRPGQLVAGPPSRSRSRHPATCACTGGQRVPRHQLPHVPASRDLSVCMGRDGEPVQRRTYVECESEDGYLRDGCVFDERIDIYDTMSVTVRYANRAMLHLHRVRRTCRLKASRCRSTARAGGSTT